MLLVRRQGFQFRRLGASRYEKPTFVHVVGIIRKHCVFLRDHVPSLVPAFFDSQNKVSVGIYRPCHGIYMCVCSSIVQQSTDDMRRLVESFA